MLQNKIQKDMMVAWKAKDTATKDTLSFLLSRIKNKGIDLKMSEIPDAEVLIIIQKLIKELEDEKSSFEKAGYTDKVNSLTSQIEIVKQYLPKQLTEAEIKSEIEKLEDKSIPSIMKYFKVNFSGKVDMSLVNRIARNI